MKEDILACLNDHKQLEKLYRSNKANFRKDFNAAYPDIEDSPLAVFWKERLSYEQDGINWGTGKELAVVLIIAVVAGLVARLPMFLSLEPDYFYQRNISLIVFPMLSAYFAWKNRLTAGKITVIAAGVIAAALFINFFPNLKNSDTLILSCIHMAIFLWSLLGFAFVGDHKNDPERRMGFLKYNGDLVVMTGLILIAGLIMTGITFGLFRLIGLNIEKFYLEYVVVFGLSAAPVLGTYLTQSNPQLVGKVSPVIAKLFSPLVLVMLVIYLVAIVYSGKNPYNNREFLLLFNGLLMGVMAIIFFSIAEAGRSAKAYAEVWILFLLSAVTLIVNGVALSAILLRISEWGITPNRAAVMGGNLLILINLVLVTLKFYKVITKKAETESVGKVISAYLPVYLIWAIVVAFIFPFIFSFK